MKVREKETFKKAVKNMDVQSVVKEQWNIAFTHSTQTPAVYLVLLVLALQLLILLKRRIYRMAVK